jgi:hypothetical protein
MIKYYALAALGALAAAAADSIVILVLTTGVTVMLAMQER